MKYTSLDIRELCTRVSKIAKECKLHYTPLDLVRETNPYLSTADTAIPIDWLRELEDSRPDTKELNWSLMWSYFSNRIGGEPVTALYYYFDFDIKIINLVGTQGVGKGKVGTLNTCFEATGEALYNMDAIKLAQLLIKYEAARDLTKQYQDAIIDWHYGRDPRRFNPGVPGAAGAKVSQMPEDFDDNLEGHQGHVDDLEDRNDNNEAPYGQDQDQEAAAIMEIKHNASKGRVELIETTNPDATIKPGDKGTIDHVDNQGTIWVNWDNGSLWGLVPELDVFKYLVTR